MAHLVAVGVLRGPSGVLLVHRRADLDYYPDYWDFPGGHIEPTETAKAALVRELHEELAIDAEVIGAPAFEISEDPDSEEGMVLSLWVVDTWHGLPVNKATDEHDELRWVRPHDLPELRLAHPSYRGFLEELMR
jgi:8-oxo-dGTP diphosphatase